MSKDYRNYSQSELETEYNYQPNDYDLRSEINRRGY
jgi:hypothetical protein